MAPHIEPIKLVHNMRLDDSTLFMAEEGLGTKGVLE